MVAVLVGLQASGKTMFCQRVLGAGFVVVSKAHFRHARHPQRRQMRLIEEALSAGRDVVVDNTNPSPREWAPLVDAARTHGARVVAYWFPRTWLAVCSGTRPGRTGSGFLRRG